MNLQKWAERMFEIVKQSELSYWLHIHVGGAVELLEEYNDAETAEESRKWWAEHMARELAEYRKEVRASFVAEAKDDSWETPEGRVVVEVDVLERLVNKPQAQQEE